MKSQERHKLKTNELAESLGKLPHYFETHGKNTLLVVIAVVVVFGGGYVWWSQRQSQQRFLSTKLMDLVMSKDRIQMMAAMNSRDEKQGEPYLPDQIIQSFATLEEQSTGGPQAMNALLQEAQIIQSKIYYSNWLLTDEQKSSILDQAEGIYEKVITQYPDNAMAQGNARLGCGIIAEERGEWEKAKDLYQQIISDQETRYAGTGIAEKANARFRQIDDISKPIEFVPAPVELPEESTAPTSGEMQDQPAVDTGVLETPPIQDNAGQNNAEGK